MQHYNQFLGAWKVTQFIFLTFYLCVHHVFKFRYTSQAGELHIDQWVILTMAQGICSTLSNLYTHL